MKNVALVLGLMLVLVMGAVLGTSCSNGGGDTPATTMAAALATTTTTTCPAGPTTYTIPLVLTAPGTLTYPPYQQVCPNDNIVWTVKNECATCTKLKVQIHDRYRVHSTSCSASPSPNPPLKDCFKKNGGMDCKPENAADAENNGGAQSTDPCTVEDKGVVQNGCYKYYLKVKVKVNGSNGNFDVDPEIEVQGGNALDSTRSPVPAASPSAPGSPAPSASPHP
jgi:hypothetical protein